MHLPQISWDDLRARGMAYLHALPERLRPHLLPLGVVIALLGYGQLLLFKQKPLGTVSPDTISYTRIAPHILNSANIFSPERTPGYPLLIAVSDLLTGRLSIVGIVLLQSLLMSIAILEIYVIVFRLSRQRWLGAVVAGALGLNLYLLDWERILLSEALAIVAIITTFYFFERYVTTERTRYLVWTMALATFAILVRPFFLYVPAVIVVLLAYRALRAGALRTTWRRWLLALVAAYGCIGLYMAGNGVLYGYWGLSFIGNVNLLGKVMEYHLENDPVSQQNQQFQTDLQIYLRDGGEVEPWHFGVAYPQYTRDFYHSYGTYSTEVILAHPQQFIQGSLNDIAATQDALPRNYAPIKYHHLPLLDRLLSLWQTGLQGYIFLPYLLLVYAVWAIVAPKNRLVFFLFVLAACIELDVVMSGTLTYVTFLPTSSFNEFYRMRAPFDWAMVITVALSAVVGTQAAITLIRTRLGQRAAVASPFVATGPEWAETMQRPAVRLPERAPVPVPPAPDGWSSAPPPSAGDESPR